MKIAIFWFRRDLRLEDNTALHGALESGHPVLPVFIMDTNILDELPPDDARVSFIYEQLNKIHRSLLQFSSSLRVFKGDPVVVWREIIREYPLAGVYCNRDYEPYAIQRDNAVSQLMKEEGIPFYTSKDQVIFEQDDIMKSDGLPYTVFTPYKKKWLQQFESVEAQPVRQHNTGNFYTCQYPIPSIESLGFTASSIKVKDINLSQLKNYPHLRNYPAADATSYLSPHLRFGTVSVRQIIDRLKPADELFLSELIWREFFMQILYHFPQVVGTNFNSKYNQVEWRNRADEFQRWCDGTTGYPMVDAGMRQLNETGYMHNRVRMVVASFLCKHLLIDWRWGEAYFAKKLLDYELSSNNGNWQWAAGTGCDAAPYFRIFNPGEQQKKFDNDGKYVTRWIPELHTPQYPQPMVDHVFARQRALDTYKLAVTTT